MLGLIPTILFIGFYVICNLKIASLAMAVGSVLQLSISKIFKIKIKTIEVVNLAISLVLVVFIFVFNKPEVFMLKPSIFGLFVFLAFMVSHIFKLGFSRKIFGSQFKFKLVKNEDLVWGVYGILILISNEVARRVLEEPQWVMFKLVFFPLLTLVFTSVFLVKYIDFKEV